MFVDFAIDPIHVESVSQDAVGNAHVKLTWRGATLPDISFSAETLRNTSVQALQTSLQDTARGVIEDAIREL